jgi:hypothetical protein
VTPHPGLHLLPRRQGGGPDALDGERRDRVRETRSRFEIVPVGKAESETGTKGVARTGLIYHFVRREAPDLDLPPAA